MQHIICKQNVDFVFVVQTHKCRYVALVLLIMLALLSDMHLLHFFAFKLFLNQNFFEKPSSVFQKFRHKFPPLFLQKLSALLRVSDDFLKDNSSEYYEQNRLSSPRESTRIVFSIPDKSTPDFFQFLQHLRHRLFSEMFYFYKSYMAIL